MQLVGGEKRGVSEPLMMGETMTQSAIRPLWGRERGEEKILGEGLVGRRGN